MKKFISLALLISVIIITNKLDFLWWSFLVPVFLLGICIPMQKWKVPPFFWGFIAGFIAWLFSTIYFEITYQGEILLSVAKIIKIKFYLLYVTIGLIGGLLTGLGVYSGYLLRKGREVLELELPGD